MSRPRVLRAAVLLLACGCASPPPPIPESRLPASLAPVHLGSSRWKCERAVLALAASSDGSRLAAGDAAGDVRILDSGTGAALHAFEDHDRRVRAVAFSPDGSLVASVGEDRRAVLRRTSDGAMVGDLRTGEPGFYNFGAACFSPDGGTLALGSLDAGVVLMDPATGAEKGRWNLQTWGVSSLCWSADGRELLCGCGDGAVRAVEVATGTVVRTLREPRAAWFPYFVLAAPAGPDGALAAVRADGLVDLWAADGSGGLVLEEAGTRFAAAAPLPDGSLLLAARDGTLRRIDPGGGREVTRFSVSPRAVLAVALVGGPERVAVAGEEGTIRILDSATGAVLAGPEGHLGPVYCVAASPDGRRVATGGRDGTVRLWDASSGAEVSILHRAEGPVYAVAFSSDGALVAAGGWEGAVHRFSATDGTAAGSPETADEPVRRIRATAGGGFEVERGYPPALEGVGGPESGSGPVVLATARSRDGRMEWSALFDGTVVGRPVECAPPR